MIWRALFSGFCAVLMLSQAFAQESGLRRLTDRDDLLGWEAVGRLDLAGQGYCTGTLIAPDLVLTAAHCVYDAKKTLYTAEKILFRAGLRDGVAIAERRALQVVAHPEYAPERGSNLENVRSDVALIRLAEPINSTDADPFILHSGTGHGAQISVTSYGQGRDEALSRQRHCNLLLEERDIMVIDCNVTFGSSGAPVFSLVGGRGRILSIISGGGNFGGERVAFGMALTDRVSELKAALRRMPVTAPDRQIKRLRLGTGDRASGAKFLRVGE